jgi:DNA-binding LacI/PurR family transcriptional regulator
MIPPITVISQDVRTMGYEAARLLLHKLDNQKNEKQNTVYVQTELIIRESVSNKMRDE